MIFIYISVPSRTVDSNLSVTDFHKCMMCILPFFCAEFVLGLVGDFGLTRSCKHARVCPVPVHVAFRMCPFSAISLIHLSLCVSPLFPSLCLFVFFFSALYRMQTSSTRVSCRSLPLCPLSTLHLSTNGAVMRIKATPIAGLSLPLVKKLCTPTGGVAPTTALSALSYDLETPGSPGWRTPTLHPGVRLPSETKV